MEHALQVEYRSPDELTPYARNARTLAHAVGISPIGTRKLLNVLESGGFAMEFGEGSEVWRLDTVQILAREERAALEVLHAATAHEREAAATCMAKRKENAPQAQTAQKGGKSNG